MCGVQLAFELIHNYMFSKENKVHTQRITQIFIAVIKLQKLFLRLRKHQDYF